MKKIIVLLICLLIPKTVLAIGTNETNQLNTVTIYVFNDPDNNIDKLKEWLDEFTFNKAYINYEIINKEDNLTLYSKNKKALKIPNNKVPLIIVGSTYFIGYDEELKEEIIEAVVAYQNNNYCDLIASIRNEKEIKDCLKTNEGIFSSKFKYTNWTLVICGFVLLLSVIIVGILKPKVAKNVQK